MPIDHTIQIYKFEELIDAAKERALNTVAEWLQETANKDLHGMFSEHLSEYGFPTDNIEWSLGYSQGDGVAFYGNVDIPKYLHKTGILPFDLDELEATIERNDFGHHYSHWNTMTLCGTVNDSLHDLISDDIKTVSKHLEKMGYDHLEVTEEEVSDYCEANNMYFLENGQLAPGL